MYDRLSGFRHPISFSSRHLAIALLGVASSALGGCADAPTGDPPSADERIAIAPQADVITLHPPTLYLTFTSHNEETITGLTPDVDYRDPLLYAGARMQLINLVNVMRDRGVKYNWQADWLFLEGVRLNDPVNLGASHNQNVVVWMANQGVEVNPHHHEVSPGPYNYGDVAEMMHNLGILGGGKVVGGFAFGLTDWTGYHDHLTSTAGTYTWRPQILWGTSELGDHDSTLYASGMWKPGSAFPPATTPRGTFVTPTAFPQQLPFLPGGCIVEIPAGLVPAQIPGLVAQIRAFYDQIDVSSFWNLRLMMNERDFDQGSEGSYVANIDALISAINTEFPPAYGQIAWATPSELVSIWTSTYGATPQIHLKGRDFVCPWPP